MARWRWGCWRLIRLMNNDAAAAGTRQPSATPQPSRCEATEGKFAGVSWDTLAASVVHQDPADSLDREFADLAKTFRLQGTPG